MGFFPVISNPTLYRRGQRLLIFGLALSLLMHTFGFLLYGMIAGRVPWLRPPAKQEPIIVLSSSTTISHRPVPQRAQPTARSERQVTPRRAQQPQRQQRQEQRQLQRQVVAAAPPVHREMTYVVPSASPLPPPRPSAAPRRVRPQPRPQGFASQLQRDQRLFAREVAQLQSNNNPLSVATIPPRPASAYRRVYFNVNGMQRHVDETAEGVITSVRDWQGGNGIRCHYARYDVVFSRGGSETGYIPWPLCYPANRDVLDLPEGSPVPEEYLLPGTDYVLPSGTYLTPFLRWLYDRRTLP